MERVQRGVAAAVGALWPLAASLDASAGVLEIWFDEIFNVGVMTPVWNRVMLRALGTALGPHVRKLRLWVGAITADFAQELHSPVWSQLSQQTLLFGHATRPRLGPGPGSPPARLAALWQCPAGLKVQVRESEDGRLFDRLEQLISFRAGFSRIALDDPYVGCS